MLYQVDLVRFVSVLFLAVARVRFSDFILGRLTQASSQDTFLRALELILGPRNLVLLPNAHIVIALLHLQASSHASRSLSLFAEAARQHGNL